MVENNEVIKIEKILKIPISAVSLKSEHAEIFSDNIFMGTVPIKRTMEDIIIYDTPDPIIDKLKWDLVYEKHKQEIFIKISELLFLTAFVITPTNFRKLSVL